MLVSSHMLLIRCGTHFISWGATYGCVDVSYPLPLKRLESAATPQRSSVVQDDVEERAGVFRIHQPTRIFPTVCNIAQPSLRRCSTF
jgi:hypothetical protein